MPQLDSESRKIILYFRLDVKNIDNNHVLQIENDSCSKFEIYSSMPAVIERLSSTSLVYPALVLIDTTVFEKQEITISETINMIRSVITCTNLTHRTAIGVTVDKNYKEDFIDNLRSCGVQGIVPKISCFGYDMTLTALKALLCQFYYWPTTLISLLVNKEVISSKSIKISLTTRQREILMLICKRGLSNKRIASTLNITESTVKVHVSAILRLYCVRNRTQLVLAASDMLRA